MKDAVDRSTGLGEGVKIERATGVFGENAVGIEWGARELRGAYRWLLDRNSQVLRGMSSWSDGPVGNARVIAMRVRGEEPGRGCSWSEGCEWIACFEVRFVEVRFPEMTHLDVAS